MSWVVQDTLRSIYGQTPQLQLTVYLAAIKSSRIEGSVVGRDY